MGGEKGAGEGESAGDFQAAIMPDSRTACERFLPHLPRGGKSPMLAAMDMGTVSLAHLFWLALVQGVTEFLPISSSGHLQLVSHWFAGASHGATLDLALHLGSLMAVLVYFRAQLLRLARGAWAGCRRQPTAASRDAGWLIAASLPILALAGLLFAFGWHDALRQPELVAWATIIFALPLYAADRWGGAERQWRALSWKSALFVGAAQSLALMPGASRAGLALTAARALGCARRDAVEMSMLLAVPVILALSAGGALNLALAGDALAWRAAGLGFALAGLFAFAAIHAMLWLSARLTLLPFVLYRLALGAGLLYLA